MISILLSEICASLWPSSINFMILVGEKSVFLPNVSFVSSTRSILHTLFMSNRHTMFFLYFFNSFILLYNLYALCIHTNIFYVPISVALRVYCYDSHHPRTDVAF